MTPSLTDAMVDDMDEMAGLHLRHVDAARAEGAVAERSALHAAEQDDPLFGARALAFIVNYIRAKGEVPGESVTMACTAAGIRPAKGDRAFGGVYSKALRNNYIRVVGYCARVRGHGTAGGRLYAPGTNSDPVRFPD